MGPLRFMRKKITPGAFRTVHVPLLNVSMGDQWPIPVTVFHGSSWSNHQRARRGPRGRIDGTKRVHAPALDEIHRTGRRLDPATMAGTLRIIPVVNLPGFRAKSRYLPDGRDLNRSFPGHATSNTTRRVAHQLWTTLMEDADAIIDIHTAAKGRSNMPQLRVISRIRRRTSWPKPSAPRSCSIPNRPEVASGEPQTRRAFHASPSKAVLRTPCSKRR